MTDILEKCARALCAYDVRAEPGDDDDYARKAAAHVDECWRNYVEDVRIVLAALKAGGFELARKHKWIKPDFVDYQCCQACGIVRRADDRNRPCIGPVRVGLRHHTPLKDEYTEGLAASNPKEEGK